MSNPLPGCFTLYEHSNYGGCSATRCANDNQGCTVKFPMANSIGQCGIMPCADNCNPDGCWGFSDKTSSIKVGEGTVVTLYDDNYHSGTSAEYSSNQSSLGDRNDKPSSWKAKINCDSDKFRFSQDCMDKQDWTINNSDKSRDDYCNNNRFLESGCKKWCSHENSNCKIQLDIESCLIYGVDLDGNVCLKSNKATDVNKYYYAQAYNLINSNDKCQKNDTFIYDNNLCSNIANINHKTLYGDWLYINGYINWFNKLDNNNISQIKSYYNPIRKKTFYDIQQKLCNSNTDNIFVLDKIGSCGFQFKNNDKRYSLITGERSIEEKLYSEYLYQNLLLDRCNKSNRFNLENNESFKYTNDPNDDECLNQWTLYEKNKTTIVQQNIDNITQLRDTKTWCPIRSNKFYTDLCNKLYNQNKKIQHDSKYQIINDMWKKFNCYGNLPYILFSYLEKIYADKWNDPLLFNLYTHYFINEFRQNNNIFARKLCYSGDVLENESIFYSTNQTLYSNNKNWLLVFQTDGNLVLYEDGINDWEKKWETKTESVMKNNYSDSLCDQWANDNECINNPSFMLTQCGKSCNNIAVLSMQSDNNLVIYNYKNEPLWASGTAQNNPNQKAFLVMQDDGKVVLRYNDGSILKTIYPEIQSSFTNNSIVNDSDNNYLYYILYILLFVIMIVFCTKLYKYYKNKTSINNNSKKKY